MQHQVKSGMGRVQVCVCVCEVVDMVVGVLVEYIFIDRLIDR